MLRDPYRPGQFPSVLSGRESELRAIRSRVGVVATYGEFGGPLLAFHGPRGLGKTSLLVEAQREAAETGILTAWVEATASNTGSNFAAELARDLQRQTADFAPRDSSFVQRLSQVQIEVGVPGFKVGAEIQPHRDGHAAASVRDLLEGGAELASEHGRKGLVLFVDEIQAAVEPERAALLNAMQEFDRRQLPVLVVAAGLPETPVSVTSAATYGERTEYHPLGSLDAVAVHEALEKPALREGVNWSPQALEAAAVFTQGYPHAVQLIGSAAWTDAEPTTSGVTITHAHVTRAQVSVESRMTGLYASRIQRLSPAEREFVDAMAQLGGYDVGRGDIAEHLSKESRTISTQRQSLLDKGFVQQSGHGLLSFTVPGIDRYLRGETSAATVTAVRRASFSKPPQESTRTTKPQPNPPRTSSSKSREKGIER